MTPREVLKKYWGYGDFRPLQEEIIRTVLEGRDTLALLPTGGGKSICFQVPAMIKEGCCLVISPLIALMEDQVNHLIDKGIAAAAISSATTAQENDAVLEACENGELKFLYLSPERLESRSFRETLGELPVSLIAVDEAHCISQWGYDFRPSYLKIAAVREWFPQVPVIALTASATEAVRQDIFLHLQMKGAAFFMTSFSRDNLAYAAEECDDKINRIIALLHQHPGSGIIYCKTRRRTKELSDLLAQHGINCDYYNAGLEQHIRKIKQENWIKGLTRMIVCTNAFGMGIDKPDVRIVIHADVPDCLENYYQEAGRAGRDRQAAKAVLLYRKKELDDLRLLPEIKYPPLSTIRKIYHALANYLQVALGEGLGEFYDFNPEDFITRFKLDSKETINSLQALKQEKLISYTDQIYVPSTVQFISGREFITAFEKSYPQAEPIIKALLRNYSGIFDVPVRISETKLAWILKRDLLSIIELLKFLDKVRIIDYAPQRNHPQIGYLHDRVRSEELEINQESYLKRKKAYALRVEAMIGFATTKTCRSAFIVTYFTHQPGMECRVCDNCMNMQVSKWSIDQIRETARLMLEKIKEKKVEVKELENKVGVEPKLFKEILFKMISEEKVLVDELGMISIRN